MIVTRRSPLTGELNSMDLPVTQEQLDLYASGTVLLQRAFPHLPAPDREFIKTGYTPMDWLEIFPGAKADRCPHGYFKDARDCRHCK